MDPINLLFQVHVQQTQTNDCWHNTVDLTGLNVRDFPSSHPEHKELTTKAFADFESKCENGIGSVHKSPLTWSGFFITAVWKELTRLKEDEGGKKIGTVEVPNGCCSGDNCSIKLFYECLARACLT